MIEMLRLSTESCLATYLTVKVTGQEHQRFLDAHDQHLRASEKFSDDQIEAAYVWPALKLMDHDPTAPNISG
jgi:hypothetical protein